MKPVFGGQLLEFPDRADNGKLHVDTWTLRWKKIDYQRRNRELRGHTGLDLWRGSKNTQRGWGGGVCLLMGYLYSIHHSKVYTKGLFIYLFEYAPIYG